MLTESVFSGNFGYSCHGCYPYSAGMHCNCDDGNGGVVNDSWYDFSTFFFLVPDGLAPVFRA